MITTKNSAKEPLRIRRELKRNTLVPSFFCTECGLNFNVCSWKSTIPARITACPACGKKKTLLHAVTYIKNKEITLVDNDIFHINPKSVAKVVLHKRRIKVRKAK